MADEVDYVLTFEELTGIIESRDIELSTLEASSLNNASTFGRGFATTGGLTKAVADIMASQHPEVVYETLVCEGIDACKKALTMARVGKLKHTFIEGMACKGGCIKGPVTMHYGNDDQKKLAAYCKEAIEVSANEATRVFDTAHINLHR